MDLEEWEFLPVPSEEGLLDFQGDGGKKYPDQESVFNMNYFICPSPDEKKVLESPAGSGIPNPNAKDEETKEVTCETLEISKKIKASDAEADDPDTISQVFFEKLKENEFVDMKFDPPDFYNRGTNSLSDSSLFHFDDKDVVIEENISTRKQHDTELMSKNSKEDDHKWEENGNGKNIWKWGLTGIGAICSFGVAAVTVCIIALGSSHKNKPNENFRFEIYTDSKRIKQVVQHASKLNEAMSAVRGVPITRAHITYGGYYDGI